MATGVKLPIEVRNGRIVLESGKAQLRKLIMLKLSDGESINPFLSYGIKPPVFSLNDQATQGLVRDQVTTHFDELSKQGRAELSALAFERQGEELLMLVEYLDLKFGTTETTILPFPTF